MRVGYLLPAKEDEDANDDGSEDAGEDEEEDDEPVLRFSIHPETSPSTISLFQINPLCNRNRLSLIYCEAQFLKFYGIVGR